MEPPGLSRRRRFPATSAASLIVPGDGSPIARRELVPERDHGGFQTFRVNV